MEPELNGNILNIQILILIVLLFLCQNLGMAVPGVILGCLGSGIFVTSVYYMADPDAGLLLSPMCLWLTIASALVYSIWDINPDEATGERQPLIPVK